MISFDMICNAAGVFSHFITIWTLNSISRTTKMSCMIIQVLHPFKKFITFVTLKIWPVYLFPRVNIPT